MVEPWYISIGMTPRQFWCGPPRLAKVYREAEKYRVRRRNEEAWRDGVYFMSALNATVMNSFRKKGTSPAEYMAEPLPLSESEVQQREERDRKLAEDRIRAKLANRAAAKTVSNK